MKTLFLLRHAKSSWENSGLSDFDRPLNDRGLETAPIIGRTIDERGFLPETIVSSPARRAQQTAELVKSSANLSCEIRFDGRIYAASTSELLSVTSEVEEQFESALLVGHNPGFENLIAVLTGMYETMPTAAFAVVKLDIEKWQEISPECGELIEIIRPKEL